MDTHVVLTVDDLAIQGRGLLRGGQPQQVGRLLEERGEGHGSRLQQPQVRGQLKWANEAFRRGVSNDNIMQYG